MKWINHKVSTFSLVFILSGDIISSFVASAGSVIPDLIEGRAVDSNKWKRRHRRISHWGLGYVVVSAFLWFLVYLQVKVSVLSVPFIKFVFLFPVFNSETFVFVLLYIGFYLSVGCILHVIQDCFSGPVPLIHPTRREFSIKIMKVGSVFEYLTSFGLLTWAVFLK